MNMLLNMPLDLDQPTEKAVKDAAFGIFADLLSELVIAEAGDPVLRAAAERFPRIIIRRMESLLKRQE